MEKRRRLRRRQINRVPYLLAACRSSLILRLSSSSHPGQSSRRSFVQMDQRNSDGSVSYRKRYSRIQTLFSSGFLFLSLSLALSLSLSLSLSRPPSVCSRSLPNLPSLLQLSSCSHSRNIGFSVASMAVHKLSSNPTRSSSP